MNDSKMPNCCASILMLELIDRLIILSQSNNSMAKFSLVQPLSCRNSNLVRINGLISRGWVASLKAHWTGLTLSKRDNAMWVSLQKIS